MNLKSIAQYRASFLMQNIAQFVMVGGEFLAVVVLMTRFTSAGQWSADEIMFFWGVMQFTFALCECLGRGISTFAYYVGSGDFDTMLLRPRPLMQQVMGHRLDPRRLGGMIVGGGAIALSCARLNIPWTAERLGLTLVAAVGGFFLILGLFLIEATVSFFSVRSIEMVNVLTYGGRATCQYPSDLYPRPLRILFTWVAPFALSMHLPISYVLGKPLFHVPTALVRLAPLAGPLFFLMMTRVWYVGVRHYRSTGT